MYLFYYTGYLEELAPHLVDVYKRTRFSQKQHLWSSNQPKLFKNLTFLHHDSHFKQKKLSHVAARYRHIINPCSTKEENLDIKNTPMFKELEEMHLSICKSNTTKNIADLFAHEENRKPRSILVEGAPGVGKTEVVKQVAYLWANRELICDMKLVFVLYLRDPIVHSLKSIENFVHQYVNNENRYVNIKQAEGAIQELRDSRGSGIAFLMDGFDEFPSRLYENSFVADLISGVVLPNALLLITSRPNTSLFLHNQASRVFDIVGFAKEEKEQYISDSLRDLPEKQTELQKYFMQYPIINSYCYIPLHLAMVIFLLRHARLPDTLTRINELFILHTIHRNLQQRSKEYKKLSLNKLVDLPREVYDIVFSLSKLAYNGVQESKLVFTSEEIKQLCPATKESLSTMNGFGLLQAVEHYDILSAVEVTTSFNFLHYSMQEYLAAFYISTLSDNDQYSEMVSVKPLHYALSAAQRQSTHMPSFWHNQFIFMWLMYIGITCGQAHAFILFLGKSGFFPSTEKASNKLRNSLNVMQILHLFQCFIEANNVKVCNTLLEHIFRDGNVCIKGAALSYIHLFSHHILSLVFFLTKSPRLYKSLEFVNCFFLDDAINTLEEYFLMHPKKGSSIQNVHFENSNFVSNSRIFGTIIKVDHVSNISIVNIGNCDISNVIESLGDNRNLNALNIQQMQLTDNNIKLLMQQLSSTKLKFLSIVNNMCTSSGIKSVANFVSKNSTLQVLNISDNIVGISEKAVPFLIKQNILPVNFLGLYNDKAGLEKLAFALENNPPLLSLTLSNNCILFIKELARALYHNTVLISLNLFSNFIFCDDQSSFDDLGRTLRINKGLKSLNISHNDISDAKMQGIVDALYYNKTLQLLDISGNQLSYQITENLAHALNYNRYLCLLALGSNSLGDEGAMHLASALKLNKTLTSLYLRDNMITNKGAVAIADALKENRVLKKLDMSMNDISDEGVSALCNIFYNGNTLKVLFLVFNPINSKEIVTKSASKDTEYNYLYHVHMAYYVYGRFFTRVTVSQSDKGVEYHQKVPGQGTAIANCTFANCTICYGTIVDKTLVFTSSMAYYNSWKNGVYKNIYFQQMYSHASSICPNEQLEEECLQCYTQVVFNSL